MAYYVYSEAADAFRSDCGRLGWVVPFDWMAWAGSPEGRRLLEDRDAIARASSDDIQRMLTTIIRSDRFTEGSLAGAFESGLVLAILERARVLAVDTREA
jgi:hypothetical protein